MYTGGGSSGSSEELFPPGSPDVPEDGWSEEEGAEDAGLDVVPEVLLPDVVREVLLPDVVREVLLPDVVPDVVREVLLPDDVVPDVFCLEVSLELSAGGSDVSLPCADDSASEEGSETSSSDGTVSSGRLLREISEGSDGTGALEEAAGEGADEFHPARSVEAFHKSSKGSAGCLLQQVSEISISTAAAVTRNLRIPKTSLG